MKKTLKKVIAVMLSLALMIVPISEKGIVADVVDGTDYILKDGVLTVLTDNYFSNPFRWDKGGDGNPQYNIQKIIVAEGVTAIGDWGFQGLEYTAEVTLPTTLKSIGNEAFQWCNALGEITIPENVETIGANAFQTSANSVTIKGTTDVAKNYAEEYASQLAGYVDLTIGPDYTLESGILTVFSDNYFNNPLRWDKTNGYNINKIILAEGVTCIGEWGFQGLEYATEIILPSTLTRIEKYAFEWCNLLPEVTIPANVESINAEAITNSGIKTIRGYNDVAKNFAESIEGVTYAEISYELEDGVLTVLSDEYFNNPFRWDKGEDGNPKYNIQKIVVMEGVTIIGDWGFQGLEYAKEVILPNTIKSIGQYSFQWCNSLGEITIPESVENIGTNAFETSTNSVVLKGTTDVAKNYAEANSIPYVDLNAKTYTIRKNGTVLETVEEGTEFTIPDDAEYGYFVEAESGSNMYKGGSKITVNENLDISPVNELSVSINEKAAIRIDGVAGIRFRATVTSDNMKAVESDSITEGTLITANDIYEQPENKILDITSTYKMVNIKNSGWYNQTVGTYCGSLVNIVEANYVRNFIGRAYVTIKYANDESEKTFYSNMTGIRSISGIANSIISSGDLDKFTLDQQALIEMFAKANN